MIEVSVSFYRIELHVFSPNLCTPTSLGFLHCPLPLLVPTSLVISQRLDASAPHAV